MKCEKHDRDMLGKEVPIGWDTTIVPVCTECKRDEIVASWSQGLREMLEEARRAGSAGLLEENV